MNKFAIKGLKIITGILFFTSFFLFSHILYVFGIEQEISLFGIGGYEGIKSILIILFGIIFFIYSLLYHKKLSENHIIGILLISAFILLSSLFSIGNGDFIFGSSEKHHGGLYYLSLLCFFTAIFIGYKKKDFYSLLHIIFIFFGILGAYALLQKLGGDPLSELYQTRVSPSRVFSTLGNANYLAGVSLILLPLTLLLKNRYYRYSLFAFSFIILILSGSYFGIVLASLYILYYIFRYNKKLCMSCIIVIGIIIMYIFNNLGTEKLGSMKARPYIWKSTISAIIESPKSLFVGSGPDTLELIFHKYKAPELNKYETSTYTADRSHNIFIDLIYFFGLFGGGIIIFFLLYAIKIAKNEEIKLSLILFLLFFSFNIPVTIHFVIIILLLAGVYKRIW